MRCLSRIFAFHLLSLVLLFPVAHANEKPVDINAAMKSMNDLRLAETGALQALLASTMQIESLLAKQPDLDALTAAKTSLVDSYAAYDRAAANVRKLLSSTEQLSDWDGRADLANDVSELSVNKLKVIADAMDKLTSSINKTEFTVYATEGWENSGMNVSTDDLLYVEASGAWTVSKHGWPMTDWRGYADQEGSAYSINNQAPLGALLFRVRGSANQHGINLDKFGKGKADASGRLEFVINDSDRGNNDGQIKLAIYQIKGETIRNLIDVLRQTSNIE